MSTSSLTETPVAAAQRLGPQIAAAAGAIEHDRKLPAGLVAALHGAGLFGMLLPRSLGGGELDLLTFGKTIEAVARSDGSTAWCLCQACGTSMRTAYLDAATARAIAGTPGAIFASGTGQLAKNRADMVDGGYRLTGSWSFASGIHHSTWTCAEARIYLPDGAAKLRADGSFETRWMVFPTTGATITETWDVMGLRGTGSDTYATDGLFIPAERTLSDQWEEPRERGPLYQFSLRVGYATGFASVGLGIAQSMLESFKELAGSKQPRAASNVMRNNAVIQAQTAQLEAQLRATRAYLHDTVRTAWEDAERTGGVTLEQRVLLRLATTYTIQQATLVGEAAYKAAGATSLFASSPLERRFRDLHAVSQHVQGHSLHYETAGQYFLGLTPDTAWL